MWDEVLMRHGDSDWKDIRIRPLWRFHPEMRRTSYRDRPLANSSHHPGVSRSPILPRENTISVITNAMGSSIIRASIVDKWTNKTKKFPANSRGRGVVGFDGKNSVVL